MVRSSCYSVSKPKAVDNYFYKGDFVSFQGICPMTLLAILHFRLIFKVMSSIVLPFGKALL
jgi:hypothetical protein